MGRGAWPDSPGNMDPKSPTWLRPQSRRCLRIVN